MSNEDFLPPDQNFLARYREDLRNYNGNYLNNIFRYKGRHWFFSNDEGRWQRDKAVYAIGKSLVNIPEARLVSENEFQTLRNLGLSNQALYMTRIAQDYQLAELPLQDLDSATAGQLIFCTLIRKRDDHEYNWSYVNGDVPIFYDNHVAFGWDAGRKNLKDFFASKGAGEAGEWKVTQAISSGQVQKYWRNAGPESKHFIYNIDNFKVHVNSICNQIIDQIEKINPELKNMNIPISSGESLADFLAFTTQEPLLTIDTLLKNVLS